MGLFGSTPRESSAQDRVDLDHLTRRVTALEETVRRLQAQLQAQLQTPAQMLPATGGSSVAVSPDTEPAFMAEVRALAAQGKKINAIKVYREHTGAGLKDAKDAVERLY